ncbi:MAG: hypothetical protein ABEI57_02775 [Halapricum sp.]
MATVARAGPVETVLAGEGQQDIAVSLVHLLGSSDAFAQPFDSLGRIAHGESVPSGRENLSPAWTSTDEYFRPSKTPRESDGQLIQFG